MLSLLAANYGSVSDIELVWTLIALIGLGFSVHNLIQALGDLKFLHLSEIANGRLILARFTIRAEIARLIIQMLFFSVGIGAMTLSEPPSQANLPVHLQIVQGLFRWALVLGASLITVMSYWAWQVRRELVGDRARRIALEEAQDTGAEVEADIVHVTGENVEVTEQK